MTDQPKKQIFISHATLDDATVDKIAKILINAGHTVWVDHDHLDVGSPSWDKAIKDAIRTCDIGLFLMSKKSLASEICEGECQLVRQLGKPLFVLRHEACDPIDIWFTIKQIQYADIVSNFDDGMARLIRVLGGERSADLPSPTHRFTDAGDMPNNLPYLSNPLRGRDADVAWIRANLGSHITQITGTGGMGKSRLSAEIALNYPQGAVWFRCESYKNSADLQIALRVHSGLPEGTPINTILAHISTQKPLIVVDNAEAVTDANRPDYITLLNQMAGNGIPILLTSRLAWKGFTPRIEHPLGFLDSTDGLVLARDFVSSEKIMFDDAQLAELAGACKYYPRLMAFSIQQLHEFQPSVIIKRLKNLSYDAHADMQEALDEMITKTVAQMATEKHGAHADALLRRLTWLTATFPEAVIEALKPDDMDEDALADALALIRRYQFIRYDDATGRYQLADLVREALGTVDTVFGIYADFYIKRAEEIFDDLPPEDWHDNEDGENADDIANIKVLGGELLRQTHDGAKGDLRRTLGFAIMTKRYVRLRMEARTWAWLEMGLQAVQTLRKADSADETLMGYEALMLGELGYVYQALGDKQKALVYKEQSFSLYQKTGDKTAEAIMMNNIGRGYHELGDNQKAMMYYKGALQLHRLAEDKDGEATTLGNIGLAYYALGDSQKVLNYYEQSLSLFRAEGNKGGEATMLNNIGGLYNALGDKQKALEYFEQALPLLRSVGNRGGEAATCFNMGMIYETLGDLDKAIALVERALLLDEQVQSPNAEDDRDTLMHLKRKRGDADVPPESAPTRAEKSQAVLKKLIEIYQTWGEDSVRHFLKRNGLSDEQIDEAVLAVKEILGDAV
jgi:tetratricopeptide (TPR) repeat protein